MSTENYWGDFSSIDSDETTPIQILQHQAEMLNGTVRPKLHATVMTSGVVGGEPRFRTTLAVGIPSIQRYSVDIVTVIHYLSRSYPVHLSDDLAPREERASFDCESEEKLRSELKRILSSDRTVHVIRRLLAITKDT